MLWFHNANRYAEPESRKRNGLAALTLYPHQMMQAALWGIPFAHYCLDAKIWHVREDKELARALGMAR